MSTDRRSEHVRSARDAGLTYVTDAAPGIRRKRHGRGFTYLDPGGSRIGDKQELRRIRQLAIPPAWTEVWICADPNGHLQVTARDARGRKQYRYHAKFRAIRDETKFGRLLALAQVLPRIRERVERDLSRPGLPRDKVLATVVRLLQKTLIRVGNDEYARTNRSFGLTTLHRRHVEVRGAKLRFEFRGKSGVQRCVSITDRRIARIVQRCQSLPGQELFKYLDDDGRRRVVDSGDINDYLRRITGRDISAKDLRTWAGTMFAATALREHGPAASERHAKRNVAQAIDDVAGRLGNTRAVCRKYYVHPVVLEAYMRGNVLPPDAASGHDRSRPSAALRRDELRVLQYLQTHLASEADAGAA